MKCSKCGKELKMSDTVRLTEDNEVVCCDCARDYRTCGCGRLIHHSNNRHKCKVCDSAYYSNPLNNYGAKPIPIFNNEYGIDKDTSIRHYGLEIEFSRVNPTFVWCSMANLYKEKLLYNKSDSSLHNGVEIVTNPCDRKTLFKLLDRMEPTLKTIKDVKRYRESAGIHIHVNRKSISPIDLIKLQYLLNIGKESNETYNKMYMLVGRKVRKTVDIDDHYFKVGQTGYYINNLNELGRYNALNCTNDNTIEFRLFKTTYDVNMIKCYVEIVDKLIEFAHKFGLKDMKIDNFIIWVKHNTTNKVLLSMIRKVEKNYGVVKDMTPVTYKIDMELLRGINVSKYYDVLKILSNYKGINRLMESLRALKDYDRCYYTNIGKGTEIPLYKQVEKTYKSVLKNKIRKEIDLLCA